MYLPKTPQERTAIRLEGVRIGRFTAESVIRHEKAFQECVSNDAFALANRRAELIRDGLGEHRAVKRAEQSIRDAAKYLEESLALCEKLAA